MLPAVTPSFFDFVAFKVEARQKQLVFSPPPTERWKL